MKPLTYLAVPYTHENPQIREWRFNKANEAAAYLMKKGLLVFSPISHSHPIAVTSGLPTDWEYWKKFCNAYLSHCNKIIILMLEGWEESVGVQNEIKIAEEYGIEIEYLKFDINGKYNTGNKDKC